MRCEGLTLRVALGRPRFGADFRYMTTDFVKSYAKPVAGIPYNMLYTTPDPSGTFDWFFTHRENAKGGMHVLPIVRDYKGREYLHVIVQKSPPMGGRPIVQLPAGLWGDKDLNESAKGVVKRELREETGYQTVGSKVLGEQLFATSPGMTTEQKAFALAVVKGTPSSQFRDAGETASIIGSMDVPLSTITNYNKFMTWINDLNVKGYTVGMDILAARALMPPNKAGRRVNVEV
jgi:hypothetical protein